jgi:nitrogen-specific signal transduction histidine kinase
VTTKEDGTGLGLAIVKKIIMDHGGTIEPRTSRWEGAAMWIRLPLSSHPAAQAALQQSDVPTDSQRSWVLARKKSEGKG